MNVRRTGELRNFKKERNALIFKLFDELQVTSEGLSRVRFAELPSAILNFFISQKAKLCIHMWDSVGNQTVCMYVSMCAYTYMYLRICTIVHMHVCLYVRRYIYAYL